MAGALLAVLLLGLAAGAYLLYLRRQAPAEQPLAGPPMAQTQPAQTQPTPPPQPPTPVAAPGAGFEIRSVPEGASVYINNLPRGKAPVVVTGLPIGEYVIRFELTGYRSLEHDAAITPADTAVRAVEGRLTPLPPEEKPASLNVVSKPAGAVIFLDGKRVGTTPKTIRELEPGKHDVEVTLDGYVPWSAHPVLKQGSQSNLTATLKKAPEPPATPPVVQTGPFALTADIQFDRKLVSGSQPVVPKGLRGQTRGTVLAKITVGKTGEVEAVDVIQSGGKLLDKVVIDAVLKWKYGSPMRDGVPVSIYFEHKFTFK
jgi:TonB family protein